MTTHASTSFLPGLYRHDQRREKVFGDGKSRPMSRHEKVNLMRWAREKMRPTEPGKHYGEIHAKYLEVLRVLLWEFHNAVTGLCFPSYETIGKKANCARSTVALALVALEKAELLTWVNRIKRVYERVNNMFGEGVHGQRSRVLRTSNGYQFPDPPDVQSSKSENRSGTEGQESFSFVPPPPPTQKPVDSALEAALMRLGSAIRTGASRA
jgi:helix-turn-helix protein